MRLTFVRTITFIALLAGLLACSPKKAFALDKTYDCLTPAYTAGNGTNGNIQISCGNFVGTTGQQCCDYLSNIYRNMGIDVTATAKDFCTNLTAPQLGACLRDSTNQCLYTSQADKNNLNNSCGLAVSTIENAFCCSYSTPPPPPTCDSEISCSIPGVCAATPNTCSANNGTRTNSGCEYTTYTNGGTQTATSSCTQVSTGSTVTKPCTIDNCDTANGYSCNASGQCVIPPQCTRDSDCPSDSNACTIESCNLSTNKCTFSNAADGTKWDVPNNYVCCNGKKETQDTCAASCQLTASPNSVAINATSAITATINSPGKTISQVNFTSGTPSSVTLNPSSDSTSPYGTIATGVASGNSAISGSVQLSDGSNIACTGTTVAVASSGSGQCTISLSPSSMTLQPEERKSFDVTVTADASCGQSQVQYNNNSQNVGSFAKVSPINVFLNPPDTVRARIDALSPGSMLMPVSATFDLCSACTSYLDINVPDPAPAPSNLVISGYVWADDIKDGIRGEYEPCYNSYANGDFGPFLSVSLSGGPTQKPDFIYKQDFACSSKYEFTNLAPGTYTVTFKDILNYEFTTPKSVQVTIP